MLISEALERTYGALASVSDAPHLDAQWLLLAVLGQKEVTWLLARGNEELPQAAARKFASLVAERASGRPLASVLGWWEFYGRRFMVNASVLVPRPSTEDLVEAALGYLRDHPARVVADIGTGSGCIAVTLALESGMRNQELSLIATDISPAALEIAQENALRHGVVDRIEFLHGDMLEPLRGRKIDLIVSNPPYLPAEALAEAGRSRDTSALRFEPSIALDGGHDGQDFTRRLLAASVPAFVEVTGGRVYFSSGAGAAASSPGAASSAPSAGLSSTPSTL
jgi:release factor glutamine methyltransferase